MSVISDVPPLTAPDAATQTETTCYHCGAQCFTRDIRIDDKVFCCDGCKLVYELINENGLCDYYKLQSHPGLSQIKAIRKDKYAYLDEEDIAKQLYRFTDGDKTIVTLYIPGVHCASCMWLLEHMNKLDAGISESRMNFSAKEITIHFSRSRTSLRTIVELLATIGYEPYISLDAADTKAAKAFNKQRIFRLGVAGFCFGNIMMLSFPEYLSDNIGIEQQYTHMFRYLNILLALPVFFYAASEFFSTAWGGLKQRTLNIDAPIVLAIIITFVRSLYEIFTNTGAGYLDSMSGIVFFMLVGRVVQERTYKSLSFTRDYKSYFPIAVNVITPERIVSRKLQDLKEGDLVQLHNDEIVPADAVIVKGNALIDYSFVTGESVPMTVRQNELVYAGGKQKGEQLVIRVVKPVAGSYLTSLWNHYAFNANKAEKNDKQSVVHVLSNYFTVILFTLAIGTAAYWYMHDASRIINAVSAMLIVACPCALLLTVTFTNGNILRIFSNNGFYLRDATVIEQLAKSNHIVFDKTGTLTTGSDEEHQYSGHVLTEHEKDVLLAVVRPSKHPNSRALAAMLGPRAALQTEMWKEVPGAGIEAEVGGHLVRVGSAAWVGTDVKQTDAASVYANIDGGVTAFHLTTALRAHVPEIIAKLGSRYHLSLLSGDNNKQMPVFRKLFGQDAALNFEQKPIDKLQYIERKQAEGENLVMIGDGLNDAGALQQSNVGITLADDVNNFTPSCDAILDAKEMAKLPSLLELARNSRTIITFSFVVSIIYNAIGLSFAMRGLLRPVSAAILMPLSTISIVVITSGLGSLLAWRKGLKLTSPH